MPQLSLRSYGTEIACHAHNFHQIVLPRRGRLAMDIAGQGGAVSLAQGAFVEAGTAHEYQAGSGDQFFVLDLIDAEGTADAVAADAFTSSPFFRLTAAQHHLLSYLDRLAAADLTTDQDATATSERWQRLGDSWGFLMLDSLASAAAAAESAVAGPRPPALRRAIDLMRSRSGEKLTIAGIARAAGISETRLFLLFRQHLATTPHAFLNDLRLKAAEHLLATTNLPIVEIALRCGQGDQAALTRRMQRRRGITPAAYRRQQRR